MQLPTEQAERLHLFSKQNPLFEVRVHLRDTILELNQTRIEFHTRLCSKSFATIKVINFVIACFAKGGSDV